MAQAADKTEHIRHRTHVRVACRPSSPILTVAPNTVLLMRVLHTSDWHIGRTFHGRDLLAEQENVLSAMAKLVVEHAVDAVVIAGDLYDRAVPSGEAVQTCQRVLADIRDAGAEIVLTSGNHDSAPRLGAFADFAAAGGLHLRTKISRLQDPVVLADEHGPVAFYGIPYLEPDPARHAMRVQDDPASRGHTGVLTEAMKRIREDLRGPRSGARSVVLAHAFVTGGAGSDSERRIAVGGVEQVPGSVFDGMDYVALGHLHGPQVLAEHLRYSGSPMAYSFSEAAHHKSVWIAELDKTGLAEVERHELPVPRRLSVVTGTLDELLTEPRYRDQEHDFVSAVLTDDVQPVEVMRRLHARFPHAVHVDWRPSSGRPELAEDYAVAVRGKTDLEIAARFVSDCRGSGPVDREHRLLRTALEALDVAEVQR